MHWFEQLTGDVSLAARQLRRTALFTTVATLTLALGIGVNAAIFALVDATLLRPLPLPAPERLAMIWARTDSDARGPVAPRDLLEWRARTRHFAGLAAYLPNVGGMVMAGAEGAAETVPRQWIVDGTIFDVLGIRPVIGRAFRAEDERTRAAVIVLSEAFWRARFNGDPGILGRSLRLDGESFTVIGVMPPEAQLIGRTSVWALRPLGANPPPGPGFLHVVGRLAPGVPLDAARAELAQAAAALAQEFPANSGRSVTVEPLHDAWIGSDLRLTALLFLGVVAFVLSICCANIANLLLARATVRTRELAIRTALGARRGHLTRAVLVESLMLSILGALLGLVFGASLLRVAPMVMPEGLLPGAVTLSFDGRVVAFCALAAVIAGMLFSLAPAWHAATLPVAQTIAAESRGATARGGRLRQVLVGAEVAAAVVLLFGAGLLLRTLLALDSVERGYQQDQVLTMVVDPLGSQFPSATALEQFYERIEREVLALPGVARVAWSSALPVGAADAAPLALQIVGAPPVEATQLPVAESQIVSAAYFDTIGLPIVTGRGFTARDTRDRVRVAIVNEAFIRRHLPDRPPLGARVTIRPPEGSQAPPRELEIVGVAKTVNVRPIDGQDPLQIYLPITQSITDDMYLLVRPASRDAAAALAGPVRAAIARLDKQQLVSVRDIATLAALARSASGRERFRAVLATTFAGVALLLAMVGVFGLFGYAVQQHARELAVRRALGATTTDLIGLIAASALRIVGLGTAVGVVVAVAFGRVLVSVLHGVEPLDPLTFASVLSIVLATAAAAIAGPSWRATRVDPAVVLRT